VAEATSRIVEGRDQDGAAQLERVRQAAIAEAPKHRRILRTSRHGQILSAVMLPLLLVLPSAGYGVLTTTGRRSGKRRRKCIRMIRRDDKVYLVQLRPPELAIARPAAASAWVWNIRSNPNVKVRIRGGTFDGIARELTDPGELAEAREALCETVDLNDYGECTLHLRGLPTRAKIKELHRYWFDTGIPLAIDLKA
jgi:deazaflavin-dependent oxidoreductase (nitroreductase family)